MKHSLESLRASTRVSEGTKKTKKLVRDEDIRDCLDTLWVHEGDLVLDGRLDLNDGAALLVHGNLTVSGSVTTDETGTLIVTGDLTCRHLYLEGNLEVQGNATIHGVVYGFYEAGISTVLGTTRARIGLFGNHDWECEDEHYEVLARFANHHSLSEGDPVVLREVLGEKAFQGLAKMMGITDEEPKNGNAAWGLSLLEHL